ncbi:MAG: gamma-butyrobetaine hydroxylase-like domain-containing protein [Gemmatimonadota bacterium]
MGDDRIELRRIATPAVRRPEAAGGRLRPVDMERAEDRLVIDWADGHRSPYAADELRRACPCATCRADREEAAASKGLRVLPADATAHAALEDVQWVGRYAFRFRWRDGHDTGIYSLEYLRELCGCAECRGASAPTDAQL